jgi:hypothetical protein
LSTLFGYAERKYGNNANTSIPKLGEYIPHTCRCISHSTWSYFGTVRRRRLGSSHSICKHKTIRIIEELQHYREGRPSYGLRCNTLGFEPPF